MRIILKALQNLFKRERGIETIEVVIILVIIVAIGFAFRYVLVDWYNYLIKGAEEQVMNGGGENPYGLP